MRQSIARNVLSEGHVSARDGDSGVVHLDDAVHVPQRLLQLSEALDHVTGEPFGFGRTRKCERRSELHFSDVFFCDEVSRLNIAIVPFPAFE